MDTNLHKVSLDNFAMEKNYEYVVSVTENFGVFDEYETEESNWGPYVYHLTKEVPINELQPIDVIGFGLDAEDVVYGENYLMFDVYENDLTEPNHYCRYNYYVVPVEY